jgi:hypothetical protein
MKPANDIRQLFRKAAATTHPATDGTVFEKVLAAHDASTPNNAIPKRSHIRSTIMRSPLTKLGIAAAAVVAVLLGISRFGGSPAGVAWGQVAQKMEASRGVIVRCTETSSVSLGDEDYAIKYLTPTHSRTDAYKDQQIVRTFYSDHEGMTATSVFHPHKHYITRQIGPGIDGFLEQHEDWTNPRYMLQTILSAQHTELEPQTIDGVRCEGIETTDPNVLGPLPGPVTRLEVEMRLWIDAKTQYPVRFEARVEGEAEGETITSEWIMDQFQWDVELDPSLFEPNIPPDYEDIRNL